MPATGLYHVGAREYDPRTGRWLQRDPVGIAGGNPNLYLYLSNDPLNRADPSGLGKQLSKEECERLLEKINRAIEHIEKELAKFDPEKDILGGTNWSPGGHMCEIAQWEKGLHNAMEDFWGGGCGRFGFKTPSKKDIDDLMRRIQEAWEKWQEAARKLLKEGNQGAVKKAISNLQKGLKGTLRRVPILGIGLGALEISMAEDKGAATGSVVGGMVGAAIGSTIGSAICPGLGTWIGGVIGGVVGGIIGEEIGRRF